MEVDGKKFYSYLLLRDDGTVIYGIDERPMPAVRKAWLDAWRATATKRRSHELACAHAEIVNNFAAKKADEYGDNDPSEAAFAKKLMAAPACSPDVDELLILDGITSQDARGSVTVLANSISAIAYADEVPEEPTSSPAKKSSKGKAKKAAACG